MLIPLAAEHPPFFPDPSLLIHLCFHPTSSHPSLLFHLFSSLSSKLPLISPHPHSSQAIPIPISASIYLPPSLPLPLSPSLDAEVRGEAHPAHSRVLGANPTGGSNSLKSSTMSLPHHLTSTHPIPPHLISSHLIYAGRRLQLQLSLSLCIPATALASACSFSSLSISAAALALGSSGAGRIALLGALSAHRPHGRDAHCCNRCCQRIQLSLHLSPCSVLGLGSAGCIALIACAHSSPPSRTSRSLPPSYSSSSLSISAAALALALGGAGRPAPPGVRSA